MPLSNANMFAAIQAATCPAPSRLTIRKAVKLHGVLIDVYKESDITNIEGFENRGAAFRHFRELVEAYKVSRNLLRSDGNILRNGIINTAAGALLTSDETLHALSTREEDRAAQQRQREERATGVEQRGQDREAEQRAGSVHQMWISQRLQRMRILDSSQHRPRELAGAQRRNGGD